MLQGASFVYVCHGGAKLLLSPAYSGPFAVVSRSPKFFILDLGERHESVSVDRLKPHAGPSIFTLAAAPRCGRPPLPLAPPVPPPGGVSVDARQISVSSNKSSRGNCINAQNDYVKYSSPILTTLALTECSFEKNGCPTLSLFS